MIEINYLFELVDTRHWSIQLISLDLSQLDIEIISQLLEWFFISIISIQIECTPYPFDSTFHCLLISMSSFECIIINHITQFLLSTFWRILLIIYVLIHIIRNLNSIDIKHLHPCSWKWIRIIEPFIWKVYSIVII